MEALVDPEDFQFQTEKAARDLLALADERWPDDIQKPEAIVTQAEWNEGSIIIIGAGNTWILLSKDNEYMV